MVTAILLLIIALLSGFIIWLLKEFFIITPKGEELVKTIKSEPTPKPADKISNSIVGKSRNELLKPIITKSKKVVSSEEMEDAFMDNEFEAEYLPNKIDKQEDVVIPEEEKSEVISTENNDTAIEEDKQIEKTICTDYEQLETSIRKIVRNQPLDSSDAKTMEQLEGTDIAEELEKAMPGYLIKAQQALAKVEY